MDAVIVTQIETVQGKDIPVEALVFFDKQFTEWHRMILPAESVLALPPNFGPSDFMFRAVLN